MRAILQDAVLAEGRPGVGSLLTAVGRRSGLADEELAGFAQRDTIPGQPVDLE